MELLVGSNNKCNDVPRRKHRKIDRPPQDPCSAYVAFTAISKDCGCGKQCLLDSDLGMDNVISVVKYCHQLTYGMTYEDRFNLMKSKMEGELVI